MEYNFHFIFKEFASSLQDKYELNKELLLLNFNDHYNTIYKYLQEL